MVRATGLAAARNNMGAARCMMEVDQAERAAMENRESEILDTYKGRGRRVRGPR